MGSQYISLRSFAKMAGVSSATASRVFSRPEELAEDTRERLLKLAEEVGFAPNMVAKSAFGQPTRSVGVILEDLSVSYFGSIAQGIQKELIRSDYLPIVAADRSTAKETLSRILRHQINALIIGVADERLDVPEICRKQIARLPIVTLEFLRPGLWCDAVLCDDYDGGRQVAEHLLACGCRSFGAGSYGEHLSNCIPRIAGFKDTLERHGFSLPPENIIRSKVELEAERRGKVFAEEFSAMLSRPDRPEGIFATNDFVALEIYKAIGQCGLTIGRDLKVAGFGNQPFSEFINPPLTSVEQNPEQIGILAAQLVLKRLGNPARDREQVNVPVKLIARASTGPQGK